MSRKLKQFSTTRIVLSGLLVVLMAPFAAAQDAEIEALEQALRPYVMPEGGPFHPDRISPGNTEIIAAWARSGHANASSRSFTNWDAAGVIPPVCATCHSGAGFRSLYGLDGSASGLPAEPVPVGGVVDCDTCHNPRLSEIKEISLPNGIIHPVSSGEASCMTCHQGRSSGQAITQATTGKGEDMPDPEISFINPHYAVAGATWLGGYGGLGYQYPGRDYSGRFFHARPVATCASCHDPHSLTVAEQSCTTCHQQQDVRAIRISRQSFDGSGDMSQGISVDLAANAARLKSLLADYAAQVAGKPMVYDGQRHPYFFADANGDGRADEVDGKPAAYDAWTPRMLKAAYNWKFVTADPGAYAHNPHYALELLYDSIEDLAGPTGFDLAGSGIRR